MKAIIKLVEAPSGQIIPTYENAEMISGEIELESTAAAASIYSAEKMLRQHVDEWGRIPHNVILNAYRVLRTDGNCRKNGKLMQSKFAGRDDATGETFSAGTEIYFRNGNAVIASPKANTDWIK